ncbi:hypothetical protein [Pseudanabaena sp. PCC 6802]|uniref:hypothetical protein n=1 Tax=Pseudanabaena sp. PCC 6802 TaxID=118173 RepID=UPI00034DBCE7|nr:hypothetical protein [Pseudanabaena sp. PCC 6802]
MANIKARNADGAEVYLKAEGAGSNVDPYAPNSLTSLIGIRQVVNTYQLVDPGFTADFPCYGHNKIGIYYKVDSINTSVDLNVEISPDGANWAKIGADINVTTNGVYFVSNPILVPAQFVRGQFVAEAGGADAVVDFWFVYGF